MVKIAFANEIKNDFEEKEKKEKENLKIKVFLSCIFGNLPKIVHFYLNSKMYFKPCSNLIWIILELELKRI